MDMLLAAFAAFLALYIVIDFEGIASRVGLLNTRDMVLGTLLILFLWEGARRVVGPALSVLGIVFTLYARITSYNVCYTKLLRISAIKMCPHESMARILLRGT